MIINAFIYKFVCNDIFVINIYVGSSVNWVKRKANHKYACNNEFNKEYSKYLYQFIRQNGGWSNWSMIKICDFPCDSKLELESEERKYMELLKADLNKYIPTRTNKEWKIIHKEKMQETAKDYYHNNNEKIKIYAKDYRIKNCEIIAEQKKIKYDCECGSCVRHADIARHMKSQKHQQFIKQSALSS